MFDLFAHQSLDIEELVRVEFGRTKKIYAILQETLQALGGKAMVVGHTPQTEGINCKYSCCIWRVYVAMSSGVLNSIPEVLEIIDNEAREIRRRTNMFSEFQIVDYRWRFLHLIRRLLEFLATICVEVHPVAILLVKGNLVALEMDISKIFLSSFPYLFFFDLWLHMVQYLACSW
ncbi:hypothetical protein C5167_023128 [Papaver somniferum]|uniref:Uncharacterized protein n=1 Tax=Papaver somniferum TaxID=3469 RepID=A0A4Y7JMY1_PAPSO|nr:hypothetical protein C5167_023128 [Papaver somniferum]